MMSCRHNYTLPWEHLFQVEALTRELQVLGELYHQQREEAMAVLSHGSKQHEWTEICRTLREEKDGMAASREGTGGYHWL